MVTAEPFVPDDFLQRHWPAVAARLGERRAAFLQLVQERCAERGLREPVHVARFSNLCFVFGTGFESRTENEWALAILLDERLAPWVKLHQLVRRAGAELERRGPDGAALAAQLRDTDARLINLFDLPAQPAPGQVLQRRPEGDRRPRTACDIEAVEARLLDSAWRQEYVLAEGQWQRRAVEPPAPLRIDGRQPPPAQLHLLTRHEQEGPPTRLQLRQIHHGRCGLGLHPALNWLDDSGAEAWLHEAARGPSWSPALAPPLRTVAPPAPQLLAEEPSAQGRVQLPSCGLRDEGVPMGALSLVVNSYPGWQWLLQVERDTLLGGEWPQRSAPPAAAPTTLRCERDGRAVALPAWQQAFDHQLREAVAAGGERLLQAWQPQVQDAAVHLECRLFDGRGGLTWGWREGPRGLASAPLQRVVALLDWLAAAELRLSGRVEYAGARADLRLLVQGQARLSAHIERLMVDVPLLQPMQAAVQRWRWPVQLEYDSLADECGCVFGEIGPVSGALTGSLGIRPSPAQGGVWEFFATLALEPVAARVLVHDPLLGRSESHLALLPSVSLLDWSLA